MGVVAVTGAGGYVGGRLVQHLRAGGHRVRPFARTAVPWLADASLLDLATADGSEIARLLEGCEAVVHLAGRSEVACIRDPDASVAETVAATRRLAAGATDAGLRRFVYLSTVHVYGAALDRLDVVDEGVIPEPRHPYAVARLASEHLAAATGPEEVVVLRLTNSVGAPVDRRVDRWTLVANDLCAQASQGGPLVLRSSGRQWRDFIDLGAACESIAEAAVGRVPPGTYNLGSGTPRTVLDLAELVADVAAETGRRPAVAAPAHEGPLPRPVRVDIAHLAAHAPPPAVPLSSSVRELLAVCAAARSAGGSLVDG